MQTCDIEFRVRYAETDQMGVVYHSHYLVWCEIGRTELIRRRGVPYADLEKRGTILAVAEANVRYLASARYDDRIRVSTTLALVRSRTLTFDYVIANADSNVTLAMARTALISLDGAGRPRALEPDLRALLGGGKVAV